MRAVRGGADRPTELMPLRHDTDVQVSEVTRHSFTNKCFHVMIGLNELSSVISPAPETRPITETAAHKRLQGRQRRAAQLLSTRTPAAARHVQHRAQHQPLADTSSSRLGPKQPGHCNTNTTNQ